MALSEQDNDPIDLFTRWLNLAKQANLEEPTAFCLSTCGENQMPAARMVLLKDFGPNGFVFYTNLKSRKSQQLSENPKAAMCFHWQPLRKQVRIQGHVESVRPSIADEYFASRSRKSRIGAWASKQSEHLKNQKTLHDRIERFTQQFTSTDVPRPDFWSGFRIVPQEIEFWEDGSFRIHNRRSFRRNKETETWDITWLYP